jgi:predicted enzyme related to lactoylglutathione lyase
VPPVSPTPTETREIGHFVWYDLLTADVAAAQRFYGSLFGWTFDEDGNGRGIGFVTIRHQGRAIGGIFATGELERDVNVSQWVSSLSVLSVEEAAARAEELGGQIVSEPQDLPNRGRTAVVRDDQGALFALLASSSGDPAVDRTRVGSWLWTELWTRDIDASVAFYQELMDYDVERIDDGGADEYRVLSTRDIPRAGVLEYDAPRLEPNWVPYVLVDDPAALVGRVEELGGRVLIAPDPSIRNGSVALIADPSGAAVTIQKWPPEGQDR